MGGFILSGGTYPLLKMNTSKIFVGCELDRLACLGYGTDRLGVCQNRHLIEKFFQSFLIKEIRTAVREELRPASSKPPSNPAPALTIFASHESHQSFEKIIQRYAKECSHGICYERPGIVTHNAEGRIRTCSRLFSAQWSSSPPRCRSATSA